MGKRPPKTTLAALRHIAGVGQKELAAVLRVSVQHIQSIEEGRRRLTEMQAFQIAGETGVSYTWLLSGNPRTPPVTSEGEPYTRIEFKKREAASDWPVTNPADIARLRYEAINSIRVILSSYLNAYRNKRIPLFLYRIQELQFELQTSFISGNSELGFCGTAAEAARVSPNISPLLKAFFRALDKEHKSELRRSKQRRRLG